MATLILSNIMKKLIIYVFLVKYIYRTDTAISDGTTSRTHQVKNSFISNIANKYILDFAKVTPISLSGSTANSRVSTVLRKKRSY